MKYVYFILLIILVLISLGGCKQTTEIAAHRGFVPINGEQHYYEIVGQGDTVVILHGGPGLSHRYLKPQLDRLLSADFTLLYYDQRGSGWTGGVEDTSHLKIQSFVNDLDSIRRYFSINKLKLLGHSFGGLLAMHYAIEYPEKVHSIILVDTDAASYALRTPYQVKTINSRLTQKQESYLDSLEQSANFRAYHIATYENYYKTFLTSYFANPADTTKLELGFDSISIPKIEITNSLVRRNLGKYDIHNSLSIITCSVLIMHGTESVFSVEGAQAIYDQLPNASINLFENCGHFQFIESPQAFKDLVIDFHN